MKHLYKQLEWLKNVSPDLLPLEVIVLLDEFAGYADGAPLTPAQETALTRINKLTALITEKWLYYVEHQIGNPIPGFYEVLQCDLGAILVAVQSYLAKDFQALLKTATDNVLYLGNYKSSSSVCNKGVELAVWLAQQKTEGQDEFLQYLMPGIQRPPSTAMAPLTDEDFQQALVIRGKYFVTWKNIFEYSLKYLRANPEDRNLKIIFDKPSDEFPLANCQLTSPEIEQLTKHIHNVSACLYNFAEFINSKVKLTSNADFLLHIASMLYKGSVHGGGKEYNASIAGQLGVGWLHEWLDMCKDEQPQQYKSLINNSIFKGILRDLRMQKHYGGSVDRNHTSTDHCLAKVNGRLKNFANNSDSKISKLLQSNLIASAKIFKIMENRPDYLQDDSHLASAESNFNNNQQSIQPINLRKDAAVSILYLNNPLLNMALLRDIYAHFSDATQAEIINAYQNSLAGSAINPKLIALQDILLLPEVAEKWSALSNITSSVQQMRLRNLTLLEINNVTRKFEIIPDKPLEKKSVKLAATLLKFIAAQRQQTEAYIVASLNTDAKPTADLITPDRSLIDACSIISKLYALLQSLHLDDILASQGDQICNFFLQQLYLLLDSSLVTDPENLNPAIIDRIILIDIQRFEKYIKPLANLINDHYLPARRYENSMEYALGDSLKNELQTLIRNIDIQTALDEEYCLKFAAIAHIHRLRNLLITYQQIINSTNSPMKKFISQELRTIAGKRETFHYYQQLESNAIDTEGGRITGLITDLLPAPLKLMQVVPNSESAATAMSLVFFRACSKRLGRQVNRSIAKRKPQIAKKHRELATAIEAVIDSLKAEDLPELKFQKVIQKLYPIIAQNTGLRLRNYSEKLIWKLLTPYLTPKELMMLHAEMTAVRLKNKQKHGWFVNKDLTTNKIEALDALRRDISSVTGAKDLETRLFAIYNKPRNAMTSVGATTSAKELRRLLKR